MAIYINTTKFKGLTDATQNSDLLALNGYNVFQVSTAPYEATYQFNLQNHSLLQDFSIESGTTNAILHNGPCYVGKYQIFNIQYDFDKPVVLNLVSPLGSVIPLLATNPFRSECFRTQDPSLKQLLWYSYDTIKNPNGTAVASGDWFSPPNIRITPTAGTSGYLRFSVKYYDKYLVQFLE